MVLENKLLYYRFRNDLICPDVGKSYAPNKYWQEICVLMLRHEANKTCFIAQPQAKKPSWNL